MKINDENYVKQLRCHDEKALFYVVEQYGGLVKSIIQRHLYAVKEVQEECMDDVLMAVWSNIGYFDETKSTFKNWIAGIARYKSIDYLRKYLREPKTSILDDAMESDSKDVLEKVIEEELSEELQLMLDCLNKEDQEIFLKIFMEEKDVVQVSRETGLNKDVIYNRVSRGKKKIKNKLAIIGKGR